MNSRSTSVSAFFPCYNDAGTIGSMVVLMDEVLRDCVDDYEIIVIDDGSSDHSLEVLHELKRKYSALKVVEHEQNKGYGGALRTGFSTASKELVFYTDGDAQYDVKEFTLLFDKWLATDADVVNGYKLKRNDPVYRIWIGKTYQYVMKFLFQLRIRDVDCDFRLLRRSVFDSIELKNNSGVICVELVRKIQEKNFVFAEVPVHHFFRTYGTSQFFNGRRILRVLRDLVKLWWVLMICR